MDFDVENNELKIIYMQIDLIKNKRGFSNQQT